jgi:hypothetical protein
MKTVEIRRGAECYVQVEGMDMRCPLCATLVRSGEQHSCKTEEPPKVSRAPRQGVLHERVTK